MKLLFPVEPRTINLPATYPAGSEALFFPGSFTIVSPPAESVLEYIRIDLFHTHLAHAVTKLNL